MRPFQQSSTQSSALSNQNLYLSLDFAPIHTENDYDGLAVEGILPAELAGRMLVRVGPNPQFEPRSRRLYLWFDGDGMINMYRFGADRVDFRNRYVRTERYKLESSAGRALYGGLQSWVQYTEPDAWAAAGFDAADVDDLLGRVERGEGPTEEQYRKAAKTILNVGNTAFVERPGGELLVFYEAWQPYRIDPSTLATGELDNFRCQVKGALIAHPIVDPTTKETFTIGYWPFAPFLTYYVIDPAGVVKSVPIDLPNGVPVMMHSFLLTETVAVFLDLPTTYQAKDIGTATPFLWQPGNGARLGVIPRHGGSADVKWYDIPQSVWPSLDGQPSPPWVFHVMNAFDQAGTVVLDVCQYPRVPMLDVQPGENVPGAQFVRWTLDPGTGAMTSTTLVADGCEFPTMDDRFKTHQQKHGYLPSTTHSGLSFNTIVHYDFEAMSGADQWWAGPTGFVSEAVFTPRAPDAPEGDGFLFAEVWDISTDKSTLVILDAMNVAAGPICSVPLPRRVPFDFHGTMVTEPGDRPPPYVPPRGNDGVAIIGSGVAGLGAAWALHSAGFDITVYEAASTVGGNAHTVDFPTRFGYRVPVDMGVILTTPWSYPNLYALFAMLGVETIPMGIDVGGSFGPDDNWASGKLTDGALWRKVAVEAARFDEEMARISHASPLTQLRPLSDFTVNYSNDFVSKVLCPVLSVLVVTRASLLQLPVGVAASMLSSQGFFAAAPWRFVKGGTRSYYDRLAALFADRIRLNTPVKSVTRGPNGVVVVDSAGREARYGQVVFATTANVALSLLADAGPLETKLLGDFQYDPASVYLHSDQAVLSPYLPPETMTQYVYFGPNVSPTLQGTMTYNMEAALGVPGPLVTVISPDGTQPPPRKVVQQQSWQHPIVTPKTVMNQLLMFTIQGTNRAWFAGAYTTAPTHEDAFVSGLIIANQMGAPYPFSAYPGALSEFLEMTALMFPNLVVESIGALVSSLGASASSSLVSAPMKTLAPVLARRETKLPIRMFRPR
jgi:carotenoid cleavage dioxygenase-like enzyme/predicted NAD/FAD-binding protein